MPEPINYFWDSCVFSAFLQDEHEAYDLGSIQSFLEDAQAGRAKIYCSTLSSGEVLPSHIKDGGSFEEFMEDYEGAVIPISPEPNVMTMSGRFRDLPYAKGVSTNRRLSTPDAIILATAIHVSEVYEVPIAAFHTFDGGGKKDLDGNRAIPILGYETWCEGFSEPQMLIANKIVAMNRCRPIHPAPRLPNVD